MLTLSIISLTFRSKELYLINEGFSFGNEEEFVRQQLRIQFEYLNVTTTIYASYLTGAYVDGWGNSDQVLWINFVDGVYYEEHMELYNIIVRIQTCAQKLYETPLAEITGMNSAFMQIYRNAPAEVLNRLNDTITDSVDKAKAEVKQTDNLMKTMVITTGVLYIGFVAGLIVPVLYSIHNIRKKLWKLLAKIPNSSIRETKMRALDRLQNFHEFEEELAETAPKLREDRIELRSSFNEIRMYLMLTVLLISVSVYTILISTTSVTDLNFIMKKKNEYVHWADMQDMLARSSIYWMREIKHPFPVFDGSNFYSIEFIEAIARIQELEYSQVKLAEISEPSSSKHFDFLYRNACLVSDCRPILKRGLHSAINELTSTEYAFVTSVLDGLDLIEAGYLELEANSLAVMDAIEESIDIYRAGTNDQIRTAYDEMKYMSVAFILFMFSFTLTAMRFTLNSIHADINNELEIPMILTKEGLRSFHAELREWLAK
jgi:hypothetical protein